MNPITQAQDLLKSLEPEKGQAEGMHGWRFDADLGELLQCLEGDLMFRNPLKLMLFSTYLLERCRRAESLQIPDLKEKVKKFGLACMDAAKNPVRNGGAESAEKQLRILCAPDEVK